MTREKNSRGKYLTMQPTTYIAVGFHAIAEHLNYVKRG